MKLYWNYKFKINKNESKMMKDDDYEFPEDSANYEDEAFEEDNGT